MSHPGALVQEIMLVLVVAAALAAVASVVAEEALA
tara:strand:- start:485 stop:589 length:105 start_codon:yes stop_codon:yes gene_type:complete